MNPIEIAGKGGKITLHCTHADEWPPTHTKLSRTLEDQRATGFIDETKYQQLLVYKRVCGLDDMQEAKCSTCPLALREEKGKMVQHKPGTGSSSKPYFARSKRNVR